MRDKALELIQRLPQGAIVLPVQTLGELLNILVRKAKRRAARARAAVLSWRDAYPVVETSAAVMVNATDLASDHGLSIWDSVVLSASVEAGCRLLLSESPRGVHVAWSNRDQPVCAGASPSIDGVAHGTRGVISSVRVWYCSGVNAARPGRIYYSERRVRDARWVNVRDGDFSLMWFPWSTHSRS